MPLLTDVVPRMFKVDDPIWTAAYLCGPVEGWFGVLIHREKHSSSTLTLTVNNGDGTQHVDVRESLKRTAEDLQNHKRGLIQEPSLEAFLRYVDSLVCPRPPPLSLNEIAH